MQIVLTGVNVGSEFVVVNVDGVVSKESLLVARRCRDPAGTTAVLCAEPALNRYLMTVSGGDNESSLVTFNDVRALPPEVSALPYCPVQCSTSHPDPLSRPRQECGLGIECGRRFTGL